jgi:hypothetical protein
MWEGFEQQVSFLTVKGHAEENWTKLVLLRWRQCKTSAGCTCKQTCLQHCLLHLHSCTATVAHKHYDTDQEHGRIFWTSTFMGCMLEKQVLHSFLLAAKVCFTSVDMWTLKITSFAHKSTKCPFHDVKVGVWCAIASVGPFSFVRRYINTTHSDATSEPRTITPETTVTILALKKPERRHSEYGCTSTGRTWTMNVSCDVYLRAEGIQSQHLYIWRVRTLYEVQHVHHHSRETGIAAIAALPAVTELRLCSTMRGVKKSTYINALCRQSAASAEAGGSLHIHSTIP